MQATVRVLGGLEITVEFSMQGAEPDVGIMSAYVEEWYITEIAGRPLRKKESADWLYKRIEAKKGEEERILEACYAAAEDAPNDYEPDYDDY